MLVKYLVMTFKTESGEKTTLSVGAIKDTLTPEDISVAMDVIIAKNALVAKGGKLIEKYNAQIVTRNVDEIEVA